MTRPRSTSPSRKRSWTISSCPRSARMHAGIALLLEQLEHFRFAEIRRHRHRERDEQPRIARGPRARAPACRRIESGVSRRTGPPQPRQCSWPPAHTAASGDRSARSSCRRSSARSARDWSGRSRWPAECPRSGPPAACPCGRGTAAHTARTSRRSGAGPRHRPCRRRARTCPSRTRPSRRRAGASGMSRSRPRRLFCRAPRMRMLSCGDVAMGIEGGPGETTGHVNATTIRPDRRYFAQNETEMPGGPQCGGYPP